MGAAQLHRAAVAAGDQLQRRWRAAMPARQLRLISTAAVFDAVREPGVHLIAAEVEVRLARVAAGDYDRYIADYVTGAAAYPGPVVLRPFAEMNLRSQMWSVDNAGGLVPEGVEVWKAAWRRIATVARAQRAPNVSLMFCVSSGDEGRPMEEYWPGAEFVQSLGIDGYNMGWRANGAPMLTPAAMIGPMYERLCLLHPTAEVTIAETSSAQGTGKAKWFEDLFSLRRFTRLRRVIFFHENKERDWRLNSDPNTLAVCRRRLRQSVGALPAPA